MTENRPEICVIGLGYVGLPIACFLASSGYSVLGVDINDEVIKKIKLNSFANFEPNLENLIKTVIYEKSLKLSKTPLSAPIYIITVQTPLDANKQPDMSYINNAIESILPLLKGEELILIESTCPIGTTEKLAIFLKTIHPKIKLAYCPERILPGNILYELKYNDRVIGGIDKESSLAAMDFYKSFTEGNIYNCNSRTAEMIKLAENTYRDINIAFANELSMITEEINVDVNEVIKFANKHPRVNILNPGPGVGGHCIAVDPWFLVFAAPGIAKLTRKAREVNVNKTEWVIKKIRQLIYRENIKTAVCLGLTYKPDSSDIRGSSALKIVEELEKEIKVFRVDPYLEGTTSLLTAIEQADLIIGLVAHKIFKDIPMNLLVDKVIMDFAEVFK